MRTLLALALLLGVTIEAAAQQIRTRELITSGVSYNVFAEENAPTIWVLVAGNNAGLYEVEVGLQLDTFLALLSAPLPERSRRTATRANVSVYRDAGTGYDLVYERTVQEALTDPTSPELAENDRVLIETVVRERFTWRDISLVFRTASTALLLYFRLRDEF